jgi:hypothetical protein
MQLARSINRSTEVDNPRYETRQYKSRSGTSKQGALSFGAMANGQNGEVPELVVCTDSLCAGITRIEAAMDCECIEYVELVYQRTD